MTALIGSIQIARKTKTAWTTQSPVLLSGQIIAETDAGQTRLKVGDGATGYAALKYITVRNTDEVLEGAANLYYTNARVATYGDTLYYRKSVVDGMFADAVKTPLPLDCSANPNYPAATKGTAYKVSVAGRIGGASGTVVEVGDLLIATVATAAGTQAAVGANWGLYQTNIDKSSETIFGTARRATTAEINAGTDDVAYVTSLKLKNYVSNSSIGNGSTNGSLLTVENLDVNNVILANTTFASSSSTNLPTVIGGAGGVLSTGYLDQGSNEFSFQTYGHVGSNDSFWFRKKINANPYDTWFQVASRQWSAGQYQPLENQRLSTTNAPEFRRLGVGGSSNSAIGIYNSSPITGGATAYGNLTSSVIQSDVTTVAYGNRSLLSTQAASFNLSSLYHFYAGQGTIGAGSSINLQVAFGADATMSGAGTNQAFRGALPAAPNNWNIFMVGQAQNYMAGNLGIGITVPTEKLAVVGNIKATGRLTWGETPSLASSIYNTSTNGTNIFSKTGSINDFIVTNGTGNSVLFVPTGTQNVALSGLLILGSVNSGVSNSVYTSATNGTTIYSKTGSDNDFRISNGVGNPVLVVPTGTPDIVVSGSISATGLYNSTSSNNASVSVNSTGTIINRVIADSSPSLIVNNQLGTGNIALFRQAGTTVVTITNEGLGAFVGGVTVPTEVYGAGWNGDVSVPTKDAVYDKIEAVISSTQIKPITNTSMTTVQTSATLNVAYPSAVVNQQIIAPNVGTGMRYEKINTTGGGTWSATTSTTI